MVNEVVGKWMVKKQQMQWSTQGAHYLLQTRTTVLNGELRDQFKQWYPLNESGRRNIRRWKRNCPRRPNKFLPCPWDFFGLPVRMMSKPRKLQDVKPYDYKFGVLQRVATHPASKVVELTPRAWKKRFAGNPMRSDLTKVINHASK